MDMDEILDEVLNEIKLSKKKAIPKRGKTTLTKKNKSAIKKASEVQKSVSPPPPQKIENDNEEEEEEFIDMMLGKNLGKFNNKNYNNMYYISHKILLNFAEKIAKNGGNIDDNFVENFISGEFNDIMMAFINNLNKRSRKSLHDDLRCMGRKIDGKQCTRRKQDGYEYCQSHYKKLTNGRIDEEMKEGKKKNKRGRKRKVEFDPRVFDNDYITAWEDIVDGDKVLVDVNNNVYTFDVQNPTYLGKKSIESTLIKVPYTEN